MNDYNQNYEDELTRLRLRLAEVELQRDAFKATLHKEVLAVVRETIIKEISAASDELSRQVKARPPSFIADLGNGVEMHDLVHRFQAPAKEGAAQPNTSTVDEQLNALRKDTLSISERLATQYNADEDLFRKINQLDARIKRLEAESNG
jgi:hypothetical protein